MNPPVPPSSSEHSSRNLTPPFTVMDDIADQLYELSDVCLAFELLEELVFPGIQSEACIEELDRKRLAAMLRVLNEALSRRIQATHALLEIDK